MKISFFSHYSLKLSSLFRKKIFFGIQTYPCNKIQLIQWYDNEDGEKKVKGELKEQKINLFLQKSWRPQSPLPPPLPFCMELCEMSHVEKTLKKLEKQSEIKLRDVKV